ncbi:MAG: (d)CMP kinase [Deltaproteobacteria bacterium]|jgi:cytidylate kinase|nr:(d)CMP kinase [Deltaproteobacteria bacterium]
MNKEDMITIDGPAGSGKSTLAKNLAVALGWNYLDTGALYRAVALWALENGYAAGDGDKVGEMAEKLELRFVNLSGENRVFISDRDVTGLIRTAEISSLSSSLSAYPKVRASLVSIQRRLGQYGALVAEGRDMGTVIFPWAKLKFFLSADPATRARRRHHQMIMEGQPSNLENVLADILARDRNDSLRQASPLKADPMAVVIDSTNLSLFEVETIMIGQAQKIFGSNFSLN